MADPSAHRVSLPLVRQVLLKPRSCHPHRVYCFALWCRDPKFFLRAEEIRADGSSIITKLRALVVSSFPLSTSHQAFLDWAKGSQYLDTDGKEMVAQGEEAEDLKKLGEDWSLEFAGAERPADKQPLPQAIVDAVKLWPIPRSLPAAPSPEVKAQPQTPSPEAKRSRGEPPVVPLAPPSTVDAVAEWARNTFSGSLLEIIVTSECDASTWKALSLQGWKELVPHPLHRLKIQRAMTKVGILAAQPSNDELLGSGRGHALEKEPVVAGEPSMLGSLSHLWEQMRSHLAQGRYADARALSGKIEALTSKSNADAIARQQEVDGLKAQLQAAQSTRDIRKVNLILTKLESLLKSNPSAPLPQVTPSSDELRGLVDLEQRLLHEASAIPGAQDRETSLRQRVDAAGNILRGLPNTNVPVTRSSPLSLFSVDQKTSFASGISIAREFVASTHTLDKFDDASLLKEELKRYESLHPVVTRVVPKGLSNATEYLELVIHKVSADSLHYTPQISAVVRLCNLGKKLVRNSESRANATGQGPYVLGYLAISIAVAALQGTRQFNEAFQPQLYPDTVSPQVWQGVTRAAELRRHRDDLALRIQEKQENAKRARDRRYMATLSGSSLTGGVAAPPASVTPASGPRASVPPVSDNWKPTSHPLDGPAPKLEALNAMRALLTNKFGAGKGKSCNHCGLHHKKEQVCHWHKLPAHRSQAFKAAYKAIREEGFVTGSEVDEWNNRPGRKPQDQCAADGKHSKGWQHLRKGVPLGPRA